MMSTYLKCNKNLQFFYLLTLLFYKRIWVLKDNDVLEWNEISLTPYFLQCAGWNWFFFGGLGIGKWICHFLFTSTRVLIILQHAWTKWKVTKTEIKFPINFTQPHCLCAEVKRAIAEWEVSKLVILCFLIRHGGVFGGFVFDFPFRKCWLMIRAQLEFEFCLQT